MKSDKSPFRVGIIGCGLIGNKRADALGKRGKLIACSDLNFSRAEKMANKFSATAYKNPKSVIADDLDIIIVATRHDSLAKFVIDAVKGKKHVFVEKPGAINQAAIGLIRKNYNDGPGQIKVRVGFNHRYHRSMLKAKEIIESGKLGELMFVRGRYGHGGRVGYDKEWRANKKLSGGGELIDQGPHLIDLSRWFLGEEFEKVNGVADTFY